MRNRAPSRPTLSWLKYTGGPSSRRTRSAHNAWRGDVKTKRSALPERSTALFTTVEYRDHVRRVMASPPGRRGRTRTGEVHPRSHRGCTSPVRVLPRLPGGDAMTRRTWSLYSTVVKRAVDLSGSALLLVFTSPLHALCALLVLLDDGPPVYFSQERVGRDGALFRIHKLRTMKAGT